MEVQPPLVIGGTDIYASNSRVRWMVTIFSVVYLVLLFCQFVAVMNAKKPVHTLYLNPSLPGTLYSERYSSPAAIAYEFIALRCFILVIFICLFIPQFRISFTASFVWSALVALLVLFQIVAFAIFCSEYAAANAQAGPGNAGRPRHYIATDDWYCCAAEIRSNPYNMCVNAPCGPPVWSGFSASNLSVNTPFYWLFAIVFALTMVDIALLVMLIVLWLVANNKCANWELSAVYDEPPRSTTAVEPVEPSAPAVDEKENQKLIIPDLAAEIKVRTHGIRKR